LSRQKHRGVSLRARWRLVCVGTVQQGVVRHLPGLGTDGGEHMDKLREPPSTKLKGHVGKPRTPHLVETKPYTGPDIVLSLGCSFGQSEAELRGALDV
jgi:hypothetical protein